MVGGAPSDPELDDWFDEPRPRPSTSESAAADDWLGGGEAARARPSFDVRSPGTRRAAIAAGVGALVLLLIGLAAGGVFSGGGRSTVTAGTTAPTTASTPAPTTATATTPAT